MGLFKRLAANHRARVDNRQKIKSSRREHRFERKETKFDHRNERSLDRVLHKDGRVHSRLEKRGSSVADQDERDLSNAFPAEAQMDDFGGGIDSGTGSFTENTPLTPFAQYDNEPNYVQGDYDTSDLGSFDPEDNQEEDSDFEDSYY